MVGLNELDNLLHLHTEECPDPNLDISHLERTIVRPWGIAYRLRDTKNRRLSLRHITNWNFFRYTPKEHIPEEWSLAVNSNDFYGDPLGFPADEDWKQLQNRIRDWMRHEGIEDSCLEGSRP